MVSMARIAAIALAMLPSAALADSVSNAYAVCKLFDSTGLTSQPCEVSGWNSAVIATIDMSSGEARKLCPQIASSLAGKGVRFDAGWTIQIKSPYSGGNSIAFCDLPQ